MPTRHLEGRMGKADQSAMEDTPYIVGMSKGVQKQALWGEEKYLPFLNLMEHLTRHLEGRSSSFCQPTLMKVAVTRMESSH